MKPSCNKTCFWFGFKMYLKLDLGMLTFYILTEKTFNSKKKFHYFTNYNFFRTFDGLLGCCLFFFGEGGRELLFGIV